MSNKAINVAADLFNFADTAGVPEEVAAAVNKERKSGLNESLYDAVVAVVTSAPKALTGKQVVFVLHKLVAAGQLEEVPAETTVRSYLNRARDNGDIGKPTRQSYWTADKDAADVGDEAEETTEETVGEDTAAGAADEPEVSDEDDEFDPLA